MEYIFFYLLQILDSLNTIACTLFLAIIVLSIVMLCFAIQNRDIFDLEDRYCESEREIWKKLQKVFCGILIAFSFLFFLPSKQTMVLFGATYLGKKTINTIVTNEKLQKIDTIINLELDKRIKELKAE